MKEKGCAWSGTVGELDTHLDPDQDNCQYVDTKCPLNCQQTIPKNEVEQHVAEECTKRDFTCQHCAFKATYEEVMNTHLPECKYVPLKCPNLCGVSCDREDMEDHMKMCRLEEVACEFSELGCRDRFERQEEEEHKKQKSLAHLSLIATSGITGDTKVIVEQQQKLQEQRIQDLEKKFEEQQKKIEILDCSIQCLTFSELIHNAPLRRETERRVSKLLLKLERIFNLLSKPEQERSASLDLGLMLGCRTITMEKFSREKAKNKVCEWRTPAMYTHPHGYCFQIGIDANGYVDARGSALSVCLWYLQGRHDQVIRWPVQATFTIELVNQKGGNNIVSTKKELKWRNYNSSAIQLHHFNSSYSNSSYGFVDHDKMDDYIRFDTIIIAITDITIL